jgi:hypothetical protein
MATTISDATPRPRATSPRSAFLESLAAGLALGAWDATHTGTLWIDLLGYPLLGLVLGFRHVRHALLAWPALGSSLLLAHWVAMALGQRQPYVESSYGRALVCLWVAIPAGLGLLLGAGLGWCARHRRLPPASGVLLTLGLVALAFAAFVELLLFFPVPGWVYLAILATLAAAIVGPRPAWRNRRAWAALGLATLVVGLMHLVPWSSRKPFLRTLDGVRPGMSVAEVRRHMAAYSEGLGWTDPDGQEITLAGALVFRHSDDGRFNADWGVVHFEKGRVTRVEFAPD